MDLPYRVHCQLLPCTDEKLQQLGISASKMIMQMQSSRVDYTSLETQGYSQQQTDRGEAAKGRCLQALTGFNQPILDLIARKALAWG